MTLTRYKISDRARLIARASGFDIEAPDKRYPVQNQMIEKALAQANRQIDPRAKLLLKGREVMSRLLGRERSK